MQDWGTRSKKGIFCVLELRLSYNIEHFESRTKVAEAICAYKAVRFQIFVCRRSLLTVVRGIRREPTMNLISSDEAFEKNSRYALEKILSHRLRKRLKH